MKLDEKLPYCKIFDKIIRRKNTIWIVIQATDMRTANEAVDNAAITGSVGSEDVHYDENGKIAKYAKVNRIKLVKPL